MQIVKPYAKILEPQLLAQALARIEYAARVSHRSEDETGTDTAKFLRAVVLGHGDWSVTEHVSISVEFLVDRGITHELVRHRIASYTQESTRFVNYVKKLPPSFIYPIPGVECAHCLSGVPLLRIYALSTGLRGQHDLGDGHAFADCAYDADWSNTILSAEKGYKALLAKGWRPQEARSVFPNALASKILVTMNLRSWRQFFMLRTSREAHPQMQQVAVPLLKNFQRLVPVLYEDIVPESRQIDNIAKGR